jgi:hypothetical protein
MKPVTRFLLLLGVFTLICLPLVACGGQAATPSGQEDRRRRQRTSKPDN